ncbi:MAG: glyoxylate/hydroxypyruvate reductase A [Cognatishimia sp.]|uniref:2-hydroxyacid dehydrogenase n=1 Tax=Cognatishimia sp. TaxID=2211648 RepID=UPI003B8C47E2
MTNVLFAAGDKNWDSYQTPLKQAFSAANLDIDLRQDHDPAETDYIIYAPSSDLQDFSPFRRCKAVLSLWAGVEKIVTNQTLAQPLCRMVDPGLTQGMIEWVTGHTLRYHLGIDDNLASQNGEWKPKAAPLARERRVTILGLGQLGQACAKMLAGIGFQVTGWSRRQKDIEGIICLSGDAGLKTALKTADILILLLPNTAETENTLNAETINHLPKGARLINPGRGTLIEDAALLSALDTGQIAHATLDVFRVEPLPQDHPYWAHTKVTVTPHIAAETRAITASEVIAENIRRGEIGLPFLNLVDRGAGY